MSDPTPGLPATWVDETQAAPTPSKVIVTAASCSVTIEATEPLDKVREGALALLREAVEVAAGTDQPGPGAGITTGFGPAAPTNAVKQRGGDFRPVRVESEGR